MVVRTLVIGDVHGCLSELNQLLAKFNYTPAQDRLIFVGDLINKGPDSLGVLERVQSLGAQVILGNHEWAFLEYLKWRNYPSPHFANLEARMGAQLEVWIKWLEALPLYLEFPDFLVVHAGLAPGQHPSQTETRILTTIRTWDSVGTDLHDPKNPAWFEFYHDPKPVIFGHWAQRDLVIRDNAIGLDTGCVYGKLLTGVVLPSRQLIQVPAQRVYEVPKV